MFCSARWLPRLSAVDPPPAVGIAAEPSTPFASTVTIWSAPLVPSLSIVICPSARMSNTREAASIEPQLPPPQGLPQKEKRSLLLSRM